MAMQFEGMQTEEMQPFHPIADIETNGELTSKSLDTWKKSYKEAFIESYHDSSQLTLVLPDDCLIAVGPPRIVKLGSNASDSDIIGKLHPIGFVSDFSYNETRQVQPLKALGSRRHIFSATNSPVQGNIGRMFFMGRNLLNTIYAQAAFGPDIMARNSRFETKENNSGIWYTNVEEDIFRVPFGLAVIYNSPATAAGGSAGSSSYYVGAEYFEACTITTKQVGLQSGQAMIMEQVGFMADRVIPITNFNTLTTLQLQTPVQSVSHMDSES